MRDGVYGVTTRYFEAGFAIRDDQVVWIAPILRKRIAYWKTVARWEGPLPSVLS